MSTYDSIILGSSPNALTAACYLARSGQKVVVLEPSDCLGGEASTIRFSDGYTADHGLMSGRIDSEISTDLKLVENGLEVIERASVTSLVPGGKPFTLPSDRGEAVKQISSLSQRDAKQYIKFMELLDLASDFLKSAYAMTPPRQHPPSSDDLENLTALVGQLKGYGRREMTEVMRLIVMSVRDLLDEWFENDQLKGLIAACAVRGLNQGPFAAGTTFNLLHHLSQGDAIFRATARGGTGSLSQVLSKAAISHGAEIRTNCGELSLLIEDGKATGVKAGENVMNATAIFSDFDALYTFTKLIAPPELEPEFNRALRRVRYAGSVARVNITLKSLPTFEGLSDEALKGTLTVAPSVAYLERAYDEGKRSKVSSAPFVEAVIPSLSDDTLAPSGKYVMSIWMQHVPHSVDVKEETISELAIKVMSEFSSDLRSLVEHVQVFTPSTYASQHYLSEGQLFGGEINLAQAFYLRPIPGYANYSTPIEQLYLCGSATHPGGISGLSGRNAAREVGVKEMVTV